MKFANVTAAAEKEFFELDLREFGLMTGAYDFHIAVGHLL